MQLTEMLTVRPDEVEEAFVKAVPGLSRDAVAVTCDSRRLSEVRVCVGRDFHFTAVPTLMSMPAGVEGGHPAPAQGTAPWRAQRARSAAFGLPEANRFASRRQRHAVRKAGEVRRDRLHYFVP